MDTATPHLGQRLLLPYIFSYIDNMSMLPVFSGATARYRITLQKSYYVQPRLSLPVV